MNTATAFATQTPQRQASRRSKWGALVRDQRGMSTVEYMILLVVVVVGGVGMWNKIGTKIYGHLVDSDAELAKVGEKAE